MSVILGPVPCQGCRRLVTWNGWEWLEHAGRHNCASHGPLKWRRMRGRQQEAPPTECAGEASHVDPWPYDTCQCKRAQDADLHTSPALGKASGGRHNRAAKHRTSQTLRNPSCGRKAGRGGTWGNGRPGPSHRYVLSDDEGQQTHTAPLPGNGGRVPRSDSAPSSAYRRLS